MFRPFKRTRKIWSTPETLLFAVSVASAIKTSVDEKTAIRRICRVLSLYDFALNPEDLGTCPQDDAGHPLVPGDSPSP